MRRYTRALLFIAFAFVVLSMLFNSGLPRVTLIFSFLTSVATIAAAGAALVSTYFAGRTVKQQKELDRQAKQPNLVLSSLNIQNLAYKRLEEHGRYFGKFGFDAELTNLGQFPIYVVKAFAEPHGGAESAFAPIPILDDVEGEYLKRDTKYIDSYDWLGHGFLIQPNASVRTQFSAVCPIPNPHEVEEMEKKTWVKIAYQYGPTGKEVHHLELGISLQAWDEDHAIAGSIKVGNESEHYKLDLELIGYYYDRPERYVSPSERDYFRYYGWLDADGKSFRISEDEDKEN